jgi:hypothetical protein
MGTASTVTQAPKVTTSTEAPAALNTGQAPIQRMDLPLVATVHMNLDERKDPVLRHRSSAIRATGEWILYGN